MQCSVLGVGPELLAGIDLGYVSQGVSSVEASGGCAVRGPCVKAKCPVPFCSSALMMWGCQALTRLLHSWPWSVSMQVCTFSGLYGICII